MQSFPQFTVVDTRLQAGRGEEFSASRQVRQLPAILVRLLRPQSMLHNTSLPCSIAASDALQWLKHELE